MSTIKVDTYLTRGGASEIAIDKLKGASSAASVSVVAEGGTTTTNLQQGLNKHWCNWTQVSTTAVYDSFNNGSITDESNGYTTIGFTNNFASINYVYTGGTNGVNYESPIFSMSGRNNKTTSQTQVRTLKTTNNGTTDPDDVGMDTLGDLA